MCKWIYGVIVGCLFVAAGLGPARADVDMEQEFHHIKKRLEQLEAEKADQGSADPSSVEADEEPGWWNRVSISGLLEVEAGTGSGFEGDDESDIVLATVELGLDAQINDWLSTHVLLLHEDDSDESIELDEGVINIGNLERTPFFLAAGRMYVPFGSYESHLLSDPLPLELGETQEAAVQVGFELDSLYGSVYTYNGDTNDGGDDQIDQFGANLGYAVAGDSFGLTLSVGYTHNIADSDGLEGALDDAGVADDLDDYVPGVDVSAVLNAGQFTLIGEYLTATESFQDSEISFKGDGAEPKAWSAEVDYTFAWLGRDFDIAISYQGTDEALALELPEKRYLAGVSVGVLDGASVGLEWARDEDYSASDGGTDHSGHSATVQLAAEF